MEKFDLFYKGGIMAVKVSNTSRMPKTAKLMYCDYLRTEDGLIGKSVTVYTSIRKGGNKNWIVISKMF